MEEGDKKFEEHKDVEEGEEDPLAADAQEATYGDDNDPSSSSPAGEEARSAKHTVWIISTGVLLVIAIALAVTLGVVLSNNDDDDSSRAVAGNINTNEDTIDGAPSTTPTLSTPVPSMIPSDTPSSVPSETLLPTTSEPSLSTAPSIAPTPYPTTFPPTNVPITSLNPTTSDVPTNDPVLVTSQVPTIINEDPFLGLGDNVQWESNGSAGLNMTILNALSNDWQPTFDQAIQDWDTGNPDALTLTTTRVEPESECTAEMGVVKVCNGNYGETQWRGINEVLLQYGYIIASTVKLNEYYLPSSSSQAQRQYTMCHELGHAFGLGHLDENFFNPDLGSCLDYTKNPANNTSPNEENYQQLAEKYGTVTSRRLVVEQENPTEKLQASDLMDAANFISNLEQRTMLQEEEATAASWRTLRHNKHEIVVMSDLGDGLSLVSSMLLP